MYDPFDVDGSQAAGAGTAAKSMYFNKNFQDVRMRLLRLPLLHLCGVC